MPLDITEKDPLAVEIIDMWDVLKGDRQAHEADWADIDHLMNLADSGDFTSPDATRRQTQKPKPLSSFPALALTNFASGLYGALINPNSAWFSLAVDDPDLNRWPPMIEWRQTATRIVHNSFRPAVSNFYDAAQQLFADLAGKGNAIQYDEEVAAERRIMDLTLPLSECVWETDAFGRVTGVIRRFRLTARQAKRHYGADSLPKKLQDAAEKQSADRFTFFMRVAKLTEEEREAAGLTRPFGSITVAEDGARVVRKKGYFEMPFQAPRYAVLTGQSYGMGLGHLGLPASRVIQLMKDANLRAGQKAADPTLLAPDRDFMPLDGHVRPGETLYGAVSARGDVMVQPLQNYAGTGLSLEMMQSEVEEIREVFQHSLINMSKRSGLSPQEVAEIRADRLRLMAPHLGRAQNEYLAPKISRRARMLIRARQFPPLPEGMPEGGDVALSVAYRSAAAQAQQAQEGAATLRVLGHLTELAQLNPRYADRISPDDAAEIILETSGADARIFRTREEADRIADERAERERQAQAMQAAQAGAGVMRDMAAAAAQGGGETGGA